MKFDKPGKFKVSASCAAIHADSEFVVEAAGQQLTGKPPRTDGWADFRALDLGQIEIKAAGRAGGQGPRPGRPELEGDQSAR